MTRLPLLRAAVLVAAALFPAAAFIGGCDSQPGSTTSAKPASTAPPKSTHARRLQPRQQATPQQPAAQPDTDELVEAFSSASSKRVSAHEAHAESRTARERLRSWPLDAQTAARKYRQFGNSKWTPRAVEAVRDEATAMRLVAMDALVEPLDAVVEPRWPCSGVMRDLCDLKDYETQYVPLLGWERVEVDSDLVRQPWGLGEATNELYRRRRVRVDQLALPSDGDLAWHFDDLASVEKCDRLSELDLADVARAKKLAKHFEKVTSPKDLLAKSKLAKFESDQEAPTQFVRHAIAWPVYWSE